MILFKILTVECMDRDHTAKAVRQGNSYCYWQNAYNLRLLSFHQGETNTKQSHSRILRETTANNGIHRVANEKGLEAMSATSFVEALSKLTQAASL